VRHGAGTVETRLSVDDDVIRVEVRDEGGGRPVLRRPDPNGPEPGGWGLRMVDQLTEAWGAIVDNSRTLVWAERPIRHLADRDAH
jgi:signal transduction histidine kinase